MNKRGLDARRIGKMNASLPRARPPRKKRTGAALATGTIGGLCFALIGGSYALEQRSILPEISIPVTPQPNPNARAFFIAAGGALKDGKAIDSAAENQRHTKNGVPIPPPASASAEEKHRCTLAEKAKLVRENQNALTALRAGFAYSFGSPPVRSFNAMFPEVSKFRSLARLLTLESEVKAARGDWNGAAGSELDAMQMAVMLPRNGALILTLTGLSCEAMARRRLWDDYKHLNAAQTLAALRRLESFELKRFPYADVMEEEKRIGQAGLLEAFRDPEKFATDMTSDDNWEKWEKESNLQRWNRKMRVKWADRRETLQNFTRYMDQVFTRSRQPYGLHLAPVPIPADPVNQEIDGEYDSTRPQYVRQETENHLLAVTLALHAYHESHGAYPDSLTAIAANVPANLLTDPFAAQGNLRYRKDGADYVLYSVGPDGRDDGGKPVYDKTRPMSSDGSERARYFVEQNSVGDVVAGVNQ